jgi:hypothetical protein
MLQASRILWWLIGGASLGACGLLVLAGSGALELSADPPPLPIVAAGAGVKSRSPSGHGSSLPNLDEALQRLLGEQRRLPLWVSAIRSQLLFAGLADRPGSPEGSFWLYLKEADQPRLCKSAEPLWLDFDPGLESLRLRWATPETGLLQLEIGQIRADGIELFARKRDDPLSVRNLELTMDRSVRERPWEIGGHLVDSRLLMKMEGRWFGPDQLLSELSGSKEPCQHIQFGFGNRAYALPMEPLGTLHWAEGRWHRAESTSAPLLRLEGSDAGKLTLSLWDEIGFAKAELSMPKLFSPGDLNSIANILKFKGLRGQRRAQIVLGSQTLVAREGDWLIKKQDGWTLLASPESRRAWLLGAGQGEVIVVQAIERRKGRPRLIAKIYNATHVESMTSECNLIVPPAPIPTLPPHP